MEKRRFSHWHGQCCPQPRMNVGLYQAAAAMNATSRWQELVAQNLADSSVPGTLKKGVGFSAFPVGTAVPGTGASPYVIPQMVTREDFRPGEITPTQSTNDFAINGPGFFEVQLPNGDRAYTRNGQFHLDERGQLVTQQGYLVLGTNGPLQFDRTNPAPLKLGTNGELSQAGAVQGTIKLVEFNDPHLLTPIDGGCFLARDPKLVPSPAQSSQAQQGFLEASNISPLSEMATLVVAMRMFEANQKVMTMQDERMGQAISALGNPS